MESIKRETINKEKLQKLIQDINLKADPKDGRIDRFKATEIILKHLGEKQ